MAKKKQQEEIIVIPEPEYAVLPITIIGDTPIRIHRLGKKMQKEFEERDANKPKPKRGPRDYQVEFMDSLYFIDAKGYEVSQPKSIGKSTRIGFPSSGFKKSMVFAARQFENLKMAELRGRFFVNQYQPFVEIKGKPRIDIFWRRIGGKGPGTGTPDRGVRAMVFPWSAKLQIRFLKNVITAESVLRLLSVAGFSVCVGEDRPDKTGGTGGMWHIANGES